jgi:hypothetical protein
LGETFFEIIVAKMTQSGIAQQLTPTTEADFRPRGDAFD